MDKVEFEFPDEQETKAVAATEVEAAEPELDIEVVDDTPPKDRGRKPMKEAPPDVTEEELAEYSEKVRHRLKHFSKGYHDERRAKEAAQREKEEALRLAQQVLAANKAMEAQLQAAREQQSELARVAAESAKVDAQRKVKAAYEAGDADALVTANEELAKAVLRQEYVANVPQPVASQETPVVMSPQNTQAPIDERAETWQRNNKWFGQDDEMTSFALGLHQKLLKQGISPRSDEYYERINARMRQVFPEQFDDVEAPEPKSEGKPRKASVVAPATRSTAPRKIVLNASQVAIAKRLGVPLELYAQKVAEEMRKQNG